MTGPGEQPIEPDDTEGHTYQLDAADDDVSGHVQPPPDWEHLDR